MKTEKILGTACRENIFVVGLVVLLTVGGPTMSTAEKFCIGSFVSLACLGLMLNAAFPAFLRIFKH